MEKVKSKKNKTIDTSLADGAEYLAKCIRVDSPQVIDGVLGSTILGDTMSVLPLLPEKSVHLVIADPPYNLDKDFHGEKFRKVSREGYLHYLEEWIGMLVPLMRPDGSIYVCCDWASSSAVEEALGQHFFVRNRITWQREKGRGAKGNWKNAMEDIWFATVSKKEYTFNPDAVKMRRKVIAPYRQDGKPKDWEETSCGKFRDTYASNFWDDISIPYWSMPENTEHPTQKPEKLIAKLMLASSNPGDIILDPFLGSGTTSVVAKKLGRKYIGIEQNPQYCVWAEQRLAMAEENNAIQGYADGVFWERNTGALQEKFRR